MVMYSSLDNVKSGIPLGGIGTGKIEILPTGLLGSLSFQNNWVSPLQDDSPGKGFLGFHFGVFIEEGEKK